MYRCAEIHNAMLELTGNANKTSEQYCELGDARITRDVKDFQIIHSWLFQKKLNVCVSLRVLLLHKILI